MRGKKVSDARRNRSGHFFSRRKWTTAKAVETEALSKRKLLVKKSEGER